MSLHSAVVLRLRRLSAIGLVLLGGGCSRADSTHEARPLPTIIGDPNVIGTVGNSSITLDALRRATESTGAALDVTLNRLVRLRMYRLYAQQRGLEEGRLHMTERAVLGRALLERLEERTKVPSEPTDAEVKTMTERRWIEFDRPEAVVTCHVVIHAERLTDGAGFALAQRLADALRAVTACDEFLDRAKKFPVVGARITAERLPPVTRQGRTLVLDDAGAPVDEGESFDLAFAEAAHSIQANGSQSRIVRTAFGWHIILLESRLPAMTVPFDERRRLLREDILQRRAKDAADDLLKEMRRDTKIAIERAAIETAGRVRVDP